MSDVQPAFEPRRAESDQVFTGHDQWGDRVRVKADADGIAWPSTQAESDLLESFDLPVARKAITELQEGVEATAAAESTTEPDSKPARRPAKEV